MRKVMPLIRRYIMVCGIIMIVSFFMCSLFGQGTVMNIAAYMGQCMLFAFIAVLSVFVYYSKEELTQKQWWVRTLIHLIVLEAVLLPIAHCWHFWYSSTDAMIYAVFILLGKIVWHMVDFGVSVKTAADINRLIRNRKRSNYTKPLVVFDPDSQFNK